MKASRTGPEITHLFFVDDLLIFGEGTKHQAGVMKEVMEEFCEASM